MVRCYVLLVWCCLIGVACAKYSNSHSQLLRPTNRSIVTHNRSKVKKPAISHHLLSSKKKALATVHLVNTRRATNHATKPKKSTIAHHLVNARKTKHDVTRNKHSRNNNDISSAERAIIIFTSKKVKTPGHKTNAKNIKLRSRLVKAKKSTIRSHFVKAKKPTIRSHFVKARRSTIRNQFVNAKKSTMRNHFVNAKNPTIRNHFVNAKKLTIRNHLVNAKKSPTANHVVKAKKSAMKNKIALARMKRLRNTMPLLAGAAGRKQLVGRPLYPEEEEDYRRRSVGGSASKVLEGIVGAKFNVLNPMKITYTADKFTKLGLKHVRTGKYVVTMKSPFQVYNYNHFVFNTYFTGMVNHRLRISPTMYKTGIVLGKATTFISRIGWQCAVIVDILRYINARVQDGGKGFHNQGDMLANILGGYIGAFTGSPLLTIVLSQAGQLLGFTIGGPYMFPLMTLGTLIGGLGGGIAGSALGSEVFVKTLHSKRIKAFIRRFFRSSKKTSKPR